MELLASLLTMLPERKTHLLEPTRSVIKDRAEGFKDHRSSNREIRSKGISLEHYLQLVLFLLLFSLRELHPLLDSLLQCCNSQRLVDSSLCYCLTIRLREYLPTLARKATSTC